MANFGNILLILLAIGWIIYSFYSKKDNSPKADKKPLQTSNTNQNSNDIKSLLKNILYEDKVENLQPSVSENITKTSVNNNKTALNENIKDDKYSKISEHTSKYKTQDIKQQKDIKTDNANKKIQDIKINIKQAIIYSEILKTPYI